MIRVNHSKPKRVVRRSRQQTQYSAEIEREIEEIERRQEQWVVRSRLIAKVAISIIWTSLITGTLVLVWKLMSILLNRN